MSYKIPKYRQKFHWAKVGMRCSVWYGGYRKYGKIIEKRRPRPTQEERANRVSAQEKEAYLRIQYDDGSKRKLTLWSLAGYASFRIELSGLDKARYRAKGLDYSVLTKGGADK